MTCILVYRVHWFWVAGCSVVVPSGMIFVKITSWKALIPKLKCSMSDRFMKNSTPDVSGFDKQISLVFGTEYSDHMFGFKVTIDWLNVKSKQK